jgi:hypothetical protein
MIGRDGEGKVSGDDCTKAEVSVECSDIRGKTVSLWISFTMTRYRVFILCYEYPTNLFSLCYLQRE